MYKMFLGVGGRLYRLPVLPEKLLVRTSAKSTKAEVLGVGEIAVAGKLDLRSVKWSSYLPADSAPIGILKALRKHRQEGKAVRLVLLGFDLDINAEYLIESFDYFEKGGELGDIYYEISLIEYKPLAAQKIELPPDGIVRAGVAQKVQLKKKSRASTKPIPESYKAPKRNESTWSSLKKLYGTVGLKEVYGILSANRELMARGKAAQSRIRLLQGEKLRIPNKSTLLSLAVPRRRYWLLGAPNENRLSKSFRR